MGIEIEIGNWDSGGNWPRHWHCFRLFCFADFFFGYF